MSRVAACLAFGLIVLACNSTPDTAEATAGDSSAGGDPFEGVWRRVEVTASDGSVIPSQPGLRLYVDGYYGGQFVQGTEPRPLLPTDSTATTADLQATLGQYAANSGTYEVSGDVITERRVVALAPQNMVAGAFATLTYRMAGDTLWLTQTATQAGPAANPNTAKFVRVR